MSPSCQGPLVQGLSARLGGGGVGSGEWVNLQENKQPTHSTEQSPHHPGPARSPLTHSMDVGDTPALRAFSGQ